MCVAQPNISGAAGAARTGTDVVTGWMERAVVIGGAKGGAESSTFGGPGPAKTGNFCTQSGKSVQAMVIRPRLVSSVRVVGGPE